jgi:hypothetical protein
LPSGVRKTVIGQPPCPGQRLHGGHVDGVDIGPLFAIDLDVDEVPVHDPGYAASDENDSCAITWHQWQAE